ncbi:MAG: hypothetical protein ACLFUH_08015 [Bacteroidales bacterium]
MTNTKRKERIKKLEEAMRIELPVDKFLSAFTGKTSINVLAVDKNLAKNDPEYDQKHCTFRGEENVTMLQYIEKKFGKEVADEFKELSL